MVNDKLADQSMDFSIHIIALVKQLKEQRESIISNQIGRSGTSIGANIREAKYAHGTADFISKLQIALKEANETGYWLELLYKATILEKNSIVSLNRNANPYALCLFPRLTPRKIITNKLYNKSCNATSNVLQSYC